MIDPEDIRAHDNKTGNNRILSDSEDEFEALEFPPPNYYLSSVLPIKTCESAPSSFTHRTSPVTKEKFEEFLDVDGRLINEHSFREAVFKGGIDSSIRKDVWKLLFGYYPYHSTKREREVVNMELRGKYDALKQRWQRELTRINAKNYSESSSSNTVSDLISIKSANQDYLFIQSQIYACRQSLDGSKLSELINIIDKDVPRTMRWHNLFKDDDSLYLTTLRNILITFAAFHETVGYAQGMNDIAGRFLVVLDSESEAYWCFSNYVEHIQIDFLEKGMINKLELLRHLLREVDADLYTYLNGCQVQDLAFCHRWLLLCFLRDFDFENGLRLFEIISSHYLEINSLQAEKARETTRQRTSEQGGNASEYQVPADSQMTFILFVCVTILTMNRSNLFSCSDVVSVFQCVNNLTKSLAVDEIMLKAEMLFYAYCQKSVVETFHIIDTSNDKS
uniref:Rab-GAP TBC domain-containing protein n=1 Tax=Strigamia maritima TaxID=126957 RepID=T1JM70_STRMM